jgi:hypothetical protein
MLPTCVLNFRCIVWVEHFQKIILWKKSPKHCHYTFFFYQYSFYFYFKF